MKEQYLKDGVHNKTLKREFQGDFTNYMRMDPRMLYELLSRVIPRLTKQQTNWRRALSDGQLKPEVTLCYMASGNSDRSPRYTFRAQHSTIFLMKVLQQLKLTLDRATKYCHIRSCDES